MIDSLSLIVPVQDAQSWLADQVRDLLDVLPELTPDFQIVIVDDGSTDQTSEVAVELARQYPQVTAVVRGTRQGLASAAQAGVRHATGQILFVPAAGSAIRAGEIFRLWRLRNDPESITVASPPRPLSESLMQRLTDWGRSVCDNARNRETSSGLQMLRRTDSAPHLTPPEPATLGRVRPTQAAISRQDPPRQSPPLLPPSLNDDDVLDWSVKAIYS